MGKPQGFLEFPRVEVGHRAVAERIKDWQEIDRPLTGRALNQQAARCMDCGIPFCHGVGCPVRNRIPEFNDLVYRAHWEAAAANLHSTNNFPEVTGRVCPAPCEAACTLAINDQPVHIKQIEYQIAERAFQEGWIGPVRALSKTGKKVAVVGSGPAGLAAAQQLVRAGHEVVVFEKDDRLGGLLRYGIPDFKLEKQILDRRLEQMVAEGVKFEPGVNVGADVSAAYLRRTFDAVCLAMGAGQPRTLDVPGADLEGVHFAMDFLLEQNRRVAGDPIATRGETAIHAAGKHVVVVGGGDTGSDCVGTSIRHKARSVTQIEILPEPPEGSNPDGLWPDWPLIKRTSTSHKEGCRRDWGVLTKSLTGTGGRVAKLHAVKVDWARGDRGWEMTERAGSELTLKADLVLLAMGFLHVVHDGVIDELGVQLDARGNVAAQNGRTSVDGLFAAGDTVRGASLVVHAIHQGREVAASIDRRLRAAP